MKPLFVAAVFALVAAPVDVGTLDQKVPTKDDLKVPKTDDGLPKVGLHADIKGAVPAAEKRTVYVLVSPLHPDYVGTWWVQELTNRTGDRFNTEAQFGEEAGGVGEYFAVLGVATDQAWSVGDQIKELPKTAAYSKVKVVKRTE